MTTRQTKDKSIQMNNNSFCNLAPSHKLLKVQALPNNLFDQFQNHPNTQRAKQKQNKKKKVSRTFICSVIWETRNIRRKKRQILQSITPSKKNNAILSLFLSFFFFEPVSMQPRACAISTLWWTSQQKTQKWC